MQVLERTVQRNVVGYARKKGIVAIKIPGRRLPDYLFLLPGAVTILIEFKRPGEVPRKAQLHEIKKIKKLGHYVFAVDSAQEGRRIIDEYFVGTAQLPEARNKVVAGASSGRTVRRSRIGKDEHGTSGDKVVKEKRTSR